MQLSKKAELAELVDALGSGPSVSNNIRVQVPGSASKSQMKSENHPAAKLSQELVAGPSLYPRLSDLGGLP